MSIRILFSVLKYILIVVNVLFIVGCFFVLIVGNELMKVQSEQNDSRYKLLNRNTMVFLVLLSMVVFSIGIIGAIKAHLPLTLIYAILMSICLGFEATTLPVGIGAFLFHIFIDGCAYLYAALIYPIKRTQVVAQLQLDKI